MRAPAAVALVLLVSGCKGDGVQGIQNQAERYQEGLQKGAARRPRPPV